MAYIFFRIGGFETMWGKLQGSGPKHEARRTRSSESGRCGSWGMPCPPVRVSLECCKFSHLGPGGAPAEIDFVAFRAPKNAIGTTSLSHMHQKALFITRVDVLVECHRVLEYGSYLFVFHFRRKQLGKIMIFNFWRVKIPRL